LSVAAPAAPENVDWRTGSGPLGTAGAGPVEMAPTPSGIDRAGPGVAIGSDVTLPLNTFAGTAGCTVPPAALAAGWDPGSPKNGTSATTRRSMALDNELTSPRIP